MTSSFQQPFRLVVIKHCRLSLSLSLRQPACNSIHSGVPINESRCWYCCCLFARSSQKGRWLHFESNTNWLQWDTCRAADRASHCRHPRRLPIDVARLAGGSRLIVSSGFVTLYLALLVFSPATKETMRRTLSSWSPVAYSFESTCLSRRTLSWRESANSIQVHLQSCPPILSWALAWVLVGPRRSSSALQHHALSQSLSLWPAPTIYR